MTLSNIISPNQSSNQSSNPTSTLDKLTSFYESYKKQSFINVHYYFGFDSNPIVTSDVCKSLCLYISSLFITFYIPYTHCVTSSHSHTYITHTHSITHTH